MFVIGVDLGQAKDRTAIATLVQSPDESDKPKRERTYAVRHLARLDIGIPYPEQVEVVSGVRKRLLDQGESVTVVVDQTGVGRAVVDMFRAAKVPVVPVTITGGLEASVVKGEHRVPKRELVGTVQVLLQTQRLKIARALPHAQTLVDELLAFKVNFSQNGHDTYGNDVGAWRENDHDDLVLATALAGWYAEAVGGRRLTWGR